MNADYTCPRLSPAECLSERPEMSPQLGDELQEPPGTHGSRSLLHRSGHPVAGVGVFDLSDAAIVAASSGLVGLPTAQLASKLSFSSEKRCRAADIPDRRLGLVQCSLI
ncbi:MAG TPA: hypothetical protein DDW50_11215 [Firmicutes bacterium]|jgi:hypothetical protein|nr:hypothetical protein [Bacillota bacterium]